ncbi:helicase-related protein [Nesterenkonia sp. DZ6]|uniref:helicase-related protein n=1 Tax=Nesterenkonia sp. DZ6 TaxID=2901229 RepID=UPI001F4D118A|nr:helicase-related protein [Nesterenkonia sp. DZ6]MCH8559679.1 helicase [Nesterenkonia sp. DZ6]
MERPNFSNSLSGLKDFQRNTVEYTFSRLWGEHDPVQRFLVADETGLGKTMVARGVVARTVDHLWDKKSRIDVVYICTNAQIAAQNLARLNSVGANQVRHADRLSLLPRVTGHLNSNKVNFIALTTGTSFTQGDRLGRADERLLLLKMIALGGVEAAHESPGWREMFRGGKSRKNFDNEFRAFDTEGLDEEICHTFVQGCRVRRDHGNRSLLEELTQCAEDFVRIDGADPDAALHERRMSIVARLRAAVAEIALDLLSPDLVILDEFQRFKDLLDAPAESGVSGARLAHRMFNQDKAKILMLSATPYKMYTLHDDEGGDDHYRDFIKTVEFLAGQPRAERVESYLKTMGRAMETLAADPSETTQADTSQAARAKDAVESELRRVMCRTERTAFTADADAMVNLRHLPASQVTAQDLRSWRTLDRVAEQLGSRDTFEYWRSTPYPLNLMERNSYQIRKDFHARVELGDSTLARALETSDGLLDWQVIRDYQKLDPGNAKLRSLEEDVFRSGAASVLWLPPSMSYYRLSGPFSHAELGPFTKRLVFSAWTVVPKAIATLLSYEADRRSHERELAAVAASAAEGAPRRYDDQLRPVAPLTLKLTENRPMTMATWALTYPFEELTRVTDPLAIARQMRRRDLSQNEVLDVAEKGVRGLLAEVLPEALTAADGSGAEDPRWYWAAPMLLDRRRDAAAADALARAMRRFLWGLPTDSVEPEGQSGQGGNSRAARRHLDQTQRLPDNLGRPPADLPRRMAELGVGGFGTSASRALKRVAGEPDEVETKDLRVAAFSIARTLRLLFNRPEVVPVVRSSEGRAYWRDAVQHALDGGLQAVLDEFVHVLVESEGLAGKEPGERVAGVAAAVVEALGLRSAVNEVETFEVQGSRIHSHQHRMSTHFAARYGGRRAADDQTVHRESSVRRAFNSPFRPFVLASTSVGQEGLDFHPYSHAVVHWNLPSNPVDMEQREGRVHRYKGHAVRKNIAADYGDQAVLGEYADPWQGAFDAAVRQSRQQGVSELVPYWLHTRFGGATIERYIPVIPYSREVGHQRRLTRTVGVYRLAFGQPRQDDFISVVADRYEELAWMKVDLSPPGTLNGGIKGLGRQASAPDSTERESVHD